MPVRTRSLGRRARRTAPPRLFALARRATPRCTPMARFPKGCSSKGLARRCKASPGAEPGHQQSRGLLMPGEEPSPCEGAACKAHPGFVLRLAQGLLKNNASGIFRVNRPRAKQWHPVCRTHRPDPSRAPARRGCSHKSSTPRGSPQHGRLGRRCCCRPPSRFARV